MNLKETKKSLFFITIIFILISGMMIVSLFLSCSKNSDRSDDQVRTGQVGSQEDGQQNITLPEYSGFVNDYTHTIKSEWIQKTEQVAINLEKKTSCEIGVAVIKNLDGLSIEEYALKLFDKWDIGKEDKDNGVLLLVSMEDRKLRIEVGYGLEPVITDLKAKEIIDNTITPAFKQNDYGPGIYNGIAAIANTIYEDRKISLAEHAEMIAIVPKKPFEQTWGFPFLIVFINLLPWIVIGSLALAASLRFYRREHKCPKCKRIGLIIKRKWLTYPTYAFPGRQEVQKTCRYCDYHELNTVSIPKKIRAYSSGSHSSGFSSGSSSGFSSGSHSSSHSSHSFGGGSSGGGGASGSW